MIIFITRLTIKFNINRLQTLYLKLSFDFLKSTCFWPGKSWRKVSNLIWMLPVTISIRPPHGEVIKKSSFFCTLHNLRREEFSSVIRQSCKSESRLRRYRFDNNRDMWSYCSGLDLEGGVGFVTLSQWMCSSLQLTRNPSKHVRK